MRLRVLSWLLAGGVLLATPHPGAAVVNCEQVRRYLSTGRSADDVAETMIIGIDEVKKCQQGGSGEAKSGEKPEPKPGDDEKPPTTH